MGLRSPMAMTTGRGQLSVICRRCSSAKWRAGSDHIPFVGHSAGEIADAVNEFLTGSRAPVTIDRVLSTVLFTDIVGSTEKAAALGDRRWRDLLDEHD
jgi:hypothetical protein